MAGIKNINGIPIEIAESQVTNLVSDLASKQSATLTDAHILVGNVSNVATDVALSGDVTLINTGALTLNTVNGNVGSFGSSTSIPTFTVNAKGLITAASGNVVIAPAGTLTGTTLASNVVTSSLTSLGTLTGLTISATGTDGITFSGTRTSASSVVTSINASDNFVLPASSPQSAYSYYSRPTLGVANGQTVGSVAGYLSTQDFNPAVTGTINQLSGFIFQNGGLNTSLTITNAFGFYGAEPNFGTNRYAARFLGSLEAGTGAGTASNAFNISRLGVVTAGTWNGGIIPLLYGGTAAALTASDGGIVYSTSSALAILSGNATANKMLLSGSSTTPTWSTSTIPTSAGTAGKMLVSDGTNYVLSTPTFPNASATSGKIIISDGTNWIASTSLFPNTVGTAGKILRSDGTTNAYTTSTFADTYAVSTLLYASSANTIAGLATANSGVLITSSGGVPSISSTLPTAVQDNITRLGTIASIGAALGVTFGGSGTTTQFTPGSVVVAGVNGVYSQDNANNFYDLTNHRQGYGITSPLFQMDIRNASATTCNMSIGKWTGSGGSPTAFGTPYLKIGGSEFTTGGLYTIGFAYQTALVDKPAIEIGAITTDGSGARGIHDFVIATSSTNSLSSAAIERMRVTSDGNVGIGTTLPTKLLHLSSSSSNEPTLVIENTNADALSANIKFYKIGGSPAAGDAIGELYFNGQNSTPTANTRYGDITCLSTVVTAGAMEGAWSFRNAIAGSVVETFRITGGNITMPQNSKFSVALVSTARSNVTGDSTGYVVVFDTVTYNIGSNFDASGFALYTAPVTGYYTFKGAVWLGELGASHTLGEISLSINTTARNYGLRGNYANMRDSNNQLVTIGSWTVLLTAGDTVGLRVQVNNSTKTVDVVNSASILTYFMGELIG